MTNPERLAAVGPTSPEHGFPLWFLDGGGLRLELALDPADPFCPAIGELPDPDAAVSFPDNFPDEAFYFLAEARMRAGGPGGGGQARLVLALEAAFGGSGEVAPGQQMVFGRIRVRFDDGVPGGTYTVTHPYGTLGPLTADDRGRLRFTADLGGAPQVFTGALDADVAPFLRWAPGGAAAPAGHVGDGTTPHAVTGSPFGTDFFRLAGPGVAGPGSPPDPDAPGDPDRIRTDLFTVQGRVARTAGVAVTRAVYAATAAAVTVDVFAASVPGQALEVRGPGGTVVAMRGGTGSDYAARTAAAPSPPPVTVTVVNTSDEPDSAVTVAPVDAVTVTDATFALGTGTLAVTATSSDTADPPPLTADGLGPLAGGTGTFTVDAPPAEVTVRSGAGGVGRRPVTLAE